MSIAFWVKILHQLWDIEDEIYDLEDWPGITQNQKQYMRRVKRLSVRISQRLNKRLKEG